MVVILLALLVLAPSPARAADPRPAEGPHSGAFCGRDAERRLREIFGRVASAAGLEWDGTHGQDPEGREVSFVYDGRRRNVSYDCDAHRPRDGPSIANTVLCGDGLVVVFGMGICEAGRSADEIAFVAAHELAHVALNHTGEQADFNDRTYESWFASALGQDERRRIRRELGPDGTQEQLEGRLWRRFLQQSRPVRERLQRRQETAADQEGLNLVGLAGYSRDSAAAMMRHSADLRTATHMDVSTRHPPSVVRERLLERLADEMRSPAH
jgi:hypothetical protein